MKKYNFLFRPLFFIFSLVFATWLVFYIEKLAPSDFGRYSTVFSTGIKPPVQGKDRITGIKKICKDYKADLIDSVQLDKEITKILTNP